MKNIKDGVKGYKVFNSDWTCREYQFEVGKIFKEEVLPKCCERGFHFCLNLADCFSYYKFDSKNKVAEVVALGEIDTNNNNNNNDSKCATNRIEIIRELSWEEVLKMVNTGHYNTGYHNAGYHNAGHRNTGDSNTGNYNTGDSNTGYHNAGDFNTGNYNTGNCNTGDSNTGHYNTGNHNTGYHNAGDFNTGDSNTGNCNTGDYNTGRYNTGDYNTGNYSSGCFNTEEKPMMLFDKVSEWTHLDWNRSKARHLLRMRTKNITEWIYERNMTEEEKINNPTYKTTEGYLKVLDESECHQIWWNRLSEDEKDVIKAIPNFDKDKFEEIMKIKIED